MQRLGKVCKNIVNVYNRTSLIIRIIIGLVIGALLGLLCPGITWLGTLGDLFVGALKAIAPVLVFALVVSALAQGRNKMDRRFGLVIFLYPSGVRYSGCGQFPVPSDTDPGGKCRG